MKNAFDIVRDFEQAVAEYCGSPYAVAVNSCTNALFLAIWHYRHIYQTRNLEGINDFVVLPKHTYSSVATQAKMIGYKLRFIDKEWSGAYALNPLPIWDSARRFTSGMFETFRATCMDSDHTQYVCVSFHWSKILGIQQGGAILHNNKDFDMWARKARFDGRTEGVKPKDDKLIYPSWHMYLSPEIAAEGLVRLMHLSKNNPDLPNDDYPDLSQMDIFK